MGAIVGTQKARGAEILLEILRSEGTQFIFGNPGTTELPLIDALVVNPDFRYVWDFKKRPQWAWLIVMLKHRGTLLS